jgi:beta-lactamase regulating signal transducer with metallopeptidase domain
MMSLIVESVLRSLLMAAMVWLGIKLFRVSNALAQKLAWSLVLLVAFSMPLLMRWQTAHPRAALTVPVRRIAVVSEAVSQMESRVRAAKLDAPESDASLPALSTTVILPQVSPLVSLDRQPVRTAQWKLSTFVPYLVPAYLAICGVLLLRLLIGVALAIRLWNRAEPASPILEPRATVRISSAIQSPVNIGSGIVLPASYTEWDRAKLQLVLAHEREHVRQGDFYLQLLASFYAALVWFSPLGWYLKRTLADLGEALSDRAALDETGDHSGYAEVLLEFASVPRKGLAHVMTGVGMARSSNLTHRIERILNDARFRRAFQHGRRHVTIAALLIPCGLLLATAFFHVQAAEVVKAHALAALQQAPLAPVPAAPPVPLSKPSPVPEAALQKGSTQASIAKMPKGALPSLQPLAPIAGPGQLSSLGNASFLQPLALGNGLQASAQSINIDSHSDDRSFAVEVKDDEGTFVILDNAGKNIWCHANPLCNNASVILDNMGGGSVSGDSKTNQEVTRARARADAHGPSLWFSRGGKSYVITDPSLIAQAKAVFGPQSELTRKQEELGMMQSELGRERGKFAQLQDEHTVRTISMPAVSAHIAELQKAVNTLSTGKTLDVTPAQLSEIQAQLAQLQASLFETHEFMNDRTKDFGEKQAELSRKQTELGQEQKRIGEEASQKTWSIIDQAVRDGKAKPVE